MIIEDKELLGKYIPDEIIIERVIHDEFGLTGGNLVMDGTKVKVIITDEGGMEVLCEMYVPFETVVRNIRKFSLITFKIDDVDYIAMFCNITEAPDSLTEMIENAIENKN